MKIDSCGALVEILQNDHVHLDEKYVDSIDDYIVRISRVDGGLMINSLVEGLHVASNDCAKCRFSLFLGSLAADYREPSHLVSAGACGALVQAFKMTEDDDARSQIICDMQMFSRSVKESRTAFFAAGQKPPSLSCLDRTSFYKKYTPIYCLSRTLKARHKRINNPHNLHISLMKQPRIINTSHIRG